MEDADQQAVMSLLEPWLPRMHARFPAALALYNTQYPAGVRAEHDDRAAAMNIWCHVHQELQREFADERGFRFLEVRQLHLLNIRDQLLLRWKKVDANGRHRNQETAQQRAFDAQEDLPGLPNAAIRLVLGYQPDPALSTIERVTVRRPLGAWVSQIVDVGDTYSWIDITPLELPGVKRARSAAA